MTHTLFEELKKWIIRVLFSCVTAALVFLFTPLYDNLVAIWEMPERLKIIETQITELKDTTRSLSGEDKVIRQVEGMSYVEEPVYVDDNVIIVIVAQKTSLGSNCTIEDVQAIFTDESRIATPGQLQKYARKPVFDETPSAQRIEVIPPPNLKVGRVGVYLILEYSCNGSTHYDRTEILNFRLLEKPFR
jgi:hypothetical protein